MKKVCSYIICLCIALSLIFIGGSGVVRAETNDKGLLINGRGAILIDADSGAVLFAQNEDARHPIASMNKIMTLLLTFEAIDRGSLDINGEITVSENASGMGGSQVFLDANTVYKTSDLVKSVVVSSANDASVALAEAIAGSEDNFVIKMNEKARSLGLSNTNFVNATGLPDPEGYSSAKDVAIIFRELIKHNKYFDYSKIYLDTLVHPSGRETELANTNKLVRFYDGCDAGKTGSTNEAKFCLCATAKKNNMRLIACVLGCENSKTRNAQVSSLFNFGFSNFKNFNIVNSEAVYNVPIKKANNDTIIAYPNQAYSQIVPVGEKNKVQVQEVFIDLLKAPVKKGDKVGELILTIDGQVIKKIDLISAENVKTISYGRSINELLKNWAL